MILPGMGVQRGAGRLVLVARPAAPGFTPRVCHDRKSDARFNPAGNRQSQRGKVKQEFLHWSESRLRKPLFPEDRVA